MTKLTKKHTHNKLNSSSINTFAKIIKKSLLLPDQKNTLELIFNYLIKIQNDIDFNTLENNITLFNAKDIGKSGAKVGTINIKNKTYIIKYYSITQNKSFKYDFDETCIQLYFPINEIIINTIFQNIHQFITKIQYLKFKKNYSHYIIPLKYIGITKNKSFIINEKVGINHNNIYMTTLHDVFIKNYIPLLLKSFNTNDTETSDELLTFITSLLKSYFNCIKFLNTNLGYINSDLKLKNVFIKKYNHKTKSKSKSKNKQFITHYIPLISDLDKATLKINNITILPRPSSYLERKLSKTKTRLSTIYNFRYNCSRNTSLCNRFKSYQFDMITLFYDIYILLYQKIYHKLDNKLNLKLYYDKLHILNTFVKDTLSLTDYEFELFYARINASIFLKMKSDIKLSFHINAMLYNFCKALNKQ